LSGLNGSGNVITIAFTSSSSSGSLLASSIAAASFFA